MRMRAISISSDSGNEDNVPLKTLKKDECLEDTNHYDNLCKHSLQPCEFCDRISRNRYSSLIHNVSHIIIPLLNQKIYQCPTCLHSFTSEKELRTHSGKKHPEVTQDWTPLVNDIHSTPRKSQTSSLSRINTNESQTKNNVPNVISIGTKKNETKPQCMKSRLVFEDDDLIYVDSTSDQLLNDLTTDCKVNIELFDKPWVNGKPDEFSSKSVHYDELKKPGVYRCKKCGKRFPMRYDAIVHESSHIQFKNSQVSLCVICKKYLIGGRNDLRHHYLTFHRGNIDKNHHTETEYLHKLLFEENVEERKTFDSKILSLCDLCFSFCKNKSSMNYECVKTVSEIGKRYECEKCGQLFFEINLVKRSLQRRALYGSQTQKKRKKTNEDRLKTIANRFKMMKH